MTDHPREEQNYKNIYQGLLSNKTYVLNNSVNSKLKTLNNQDFNVKIQKETRDDYNVVDYCCNDQDFDFITRYLANNPEFTDKYKNIAVNLYELILDRVIKEWKVFQLTLIKKYYKEKNNKTRTKQCDICTFEKETFGNSIITCNGCNISVHQDCYGVPNIDKFSDIEKVKNRFYFLDALWFCRKCIFFSDKVPKCKYCLLEGGTYKQIYNSKRWAHVLCVHFIDTLSFSNTIFLEPVEELKDDSALQYSADHERGKKHKKDNYYKTCHLCMNVRGRVYKCAYKSCDSFYHITCGINNLLYFDIKNKLSYCKLHDPENSKIETSILDVFIKALKGLGKRKRMFKTFKYVPVIRKRIALKEIGETFIFKVHHMKPRFTDYVANRIIANDLCHFPDQLIIKYLIEIGMFWNIKCNRFYEIYDILSMDKTNLEEWSKNRSMVCLMSNKESFLYENFVDTKLKQIASLKKKHKDENKETDSNDEHTNTIFDEIVFSQNNLLKIRDVSVDFVNNAVYHLRLLRNIFYKLKEQESISLEIYKIDYQFFSMIANHNKHKMFLILSKLRRTCNFGVFEKPVTDDIAPNYSKLIKEPKCFQDIAENIYGSDYTEKQFKNDLALIANNCLEYNTNNTWFINAALELNKVVAKLLETENSMPTEYSLELFLQIIDNKAEI